MEEISIKVPAGEDVAKHLQRQGIGADNYRILARSLDARRARQGRRPVYTYRISLGSEVGKSAFSPDVSNGLPQYSPLFRPPVIVGAGPAGLFCCLRLLDYNIPSIIVERGASARERMIHISKFWRAGELNSESNVCFGEGGAGLFSDGKLNTRVKSPLVSYVMKKFVQMGAPEEILFESSPHLGSNRIRKLIAKMTEYIQSQGSLVLRGEKAQEIFLEPGAGRTVKGVQLARGSFLQTNHLIIATGHSARDMSQHLQALGVEAKEKDFAVGVRIEHPRRFIDETQYGKFAKELGSARYRLSHYNQETERGSYSFCMCPGGHVLSSGSEPGRLVSNGMSNAACNSPWSNAAIVVSVNAADWKKILGENASGFDFQELLEKRAYELSAKLATGKELPAMRVSDFLKPGARALTLPPSSSPSRLVAADIRTIFPDFINQHLKDALKQFNHQIPGLIQSDAVMIAPETRTSSPVQFPRDSKTLISSNTDGLYPCGEGAGHAGGITSAAVDGVRVADAIVKKEFMS